MVKLGGEVRYAALFQGVGKLETEFRLNAGGLPENLRMTWQDFKNDATWNIHNVPIEAIEFVYKQIQRLRQEVRAINSLTITAES